MVYTYNPSPREPRRMAWVWGHPGIHSVIVNELLPWQDRNSLGDGLWHAFGNYLTCTIKAGRSGLYKNVTMTEYLNVYITALFFAFDWLRCDWLLQHPATLTSLQWRTVTWNCEPNERFLPQVDFARVFISPTEKKLRHIVSFRSAWPTEWVGPWLCGRETMNRM